MGGTTRGISSDSEYSNLVPTDGSPRGRKCRHVVRTHKIKTKDGTNGLKRLMLQGSIDASLHVLVEFCLLKGRVPACTK